MHYYLWTISSSGTSRLITTSTCSFWFSVSACFKVLGNPSSQKKSWTICIKLVNVVNYLPSRSQLWCFKSASSLMINADITSSGTREPLSIKVLAINPTSVLAPICERNKSKCLNDGFLHERVNRKWLSDNLTSARQVFQLEITNDPWRYCSFSGCWSTKNNRSENGAWP